MTDISVLPVKFVWWQ